jgi:hypothetical protein
MRTSLDQLLQDLIDIANKKNPKIPYQLHDGLSRIIHAFGKAGDAVAFLQDYQFQRGEP